MAYYLQLWLKKAGGEKCTILDDVSNFNMCGPNMLLANIEFVIVFDS